jgi:hypothetical protein
MYAALQGWIAVFLWNKKKEQLSNKWLSSIILYVVPEDTSRIH